MVQRSREKEEGQQHINGIKNISLKFCTATRVRNYDQKSFGRPDSGATWNSFRSRRFLASHVSSQKLDIQAMGSSTEGTSVSYSELFM
ncbi:hypothetical protein TNCV_4616181 [Trichonephila clavipes]|nr:hypothetical protein TNCV_4616181 [Trichonephila clavipes]